jgi:DNA-binding HxlR family transcriptional regulator
MKYIALAISFVLYCKAAWYSWRVPERSYGQICPIARSLDVLGERWTLLLVRELLLGPKRFTDLLAALPAMGTNRLGKRLRRLETAGAIAKRTLPPPSGARVYELTPSGERLRPAVYCLGAWGAELPLPEDVDPATARAELIALGLSGTSPPELSAEIYETYEFHVANECFHVVAAHGVVTTRSGAAPGAPDLRVECDLPTFFALVTGASTPSQAMGQPGVSVRGGRPLLARAMRVLSFRHAAHDLRLVPA